MKLLLSALVILSGFHFARVAWDTIFVPTLGGLTVEVDTSDVTDLADFGAKVKSNLEGWYNPIKNILYSDQFKEISRLQVVFDPNYNGVAYALWTENRIVGSAKYYRNHPDDVGSMIHELAHIIQQYPSAATVVCPGWITEGVADWVRYFVYEPNSIRSPKPPKANQHYTDGYGTTAFFFNYLNSKWNSSEYPKGKIVSWLNRDCRNATYKDTVFKNMLGQTADELWTEMLKVFATFVVKVDPSQAPDLAMLGWNIKRTLEEWYPFFAKMLNSSSFQPVSSLKVAFVPMMDGAMGYHILRKNIIVGSADYFRKHMDMGFWVKNMMHFVQQYRGSTCPSWIKSGIAEWGWRWHVVPHRMTSKPVRGYYKEGWSTAAYFLNWLNGNKTKGVIYRLNKECRDNTFDEGTFQRVTGKTADEKWNEMMQG